MTAFKSIAIIAAIGMATAAPAQASNTATAPESQAEVFEQFKALEGRYLEDAEPESQAKVEYQLWSRDTAVMEIWNMPTKREFTVFHMDGDKLVATHYCGNRIQVTMDMVWPAEDGEYKFKARYVSNHASPDAPYNSGFSYRFHANGNVWRNEQWTTAGKMVEGDQMLIRQADSSGG